MLITGYFVKCLNGIVILPVPIPNAFGAGNADETNEVSEIVVE